MMARFRQLRLLWAVLLGLVCVTMGQAATSAERSDFGQSSLAAKGGGEAFSKEKEALVEMAQNDKKTGMTSADMQA